jgi:hypothetical protein
MAWQRPVDLAHTGQDIVAMAKHCDVLSPMIYPSHFFGMDGIAHPGDAPEHFIGESMDRFKLITKDSGVVIRPWLQAFAWRTKTYSPQYVEVQTEVAKQKVASAFFSGTPITTTRSPTSPCRKCAPPKTKTATSEATKWAPNPNQSQQLRLPQPYRPSPYPAQM